MANTAKTEALAMLKEDHKRVKALLNQLKKTEGTAPGRRTKLLSEITAELQMHMLIEEQIFYPAFREALDSKEGEKLYYEALEEHRAATLVLEDTAKADPKSPSFGGKAKVLAELITHHADEEEEEMFPKARKALSLEERREIGARMKELKESKPAKAA